MSTDADQDLGVLLNLAFLSFRQALDADLAAAGYDDLGASFGYVFRRLAEGECSLTELAEQLGMTPPGALKVVEDMVQKGYVERLDDPNDRRVKRLVLTARGRAALRRARQFHARYEEALAGRWGAGKIDSLRRVLAGMVADAGPVPRRPRPV